MKSCHEQMYSMHIVWFFNLAFHRHFSSCSVLNHLLSPVVLIISIKYDTCLIGF